MLVGVTAGLLILTLRLECELHYIQSEPKYTSDYYTSLQNRTVPIMITVKFFTYYLTLNNMYKIEICLRQHDLPTIVITGETYLKVGGFLVS